MLTANFVWHGKCIKYESFCFLHIVHLINSDLCLLNSLKIILQGFRAFNTLGTPILRSSILCRSMLKFINSLLHYLTFEVRFSIFNKHIGGKCWNPDSLGVYLSQVLEPNWHLMHDRLRTAKSIDEVCGLDIICLGTFMNYRNSTGFTYLLLDNAYRSSSFMTSSSRNV